MSALFSVLEVSRRRHFKCWGVAGCPIASSVFRIDFVVFVYYDVECRPLFHAEREGIHLAFGGTPDFGRRSVGYVGSSDGWQDLKDDFQMNWEFQRAEDGNIATGLTKFGAIVGDRTEIGCNAVINPGSVLGRDCIIYPGTNFRGVLPHSSIVKVRQEQQVLARREPSQLKS